MMKSKLNTIVFVTFILLYTLLISNTVKAQIPQQFKYQAVLRDAGGNIIASQAKTIIVDILKDSSTGPIVFTETHKVTTSSLGIINLNIGSINKTAIAAINWSNSSYFIKITVDGLVMGTSQLLSVPYALYAKTSGVIVPSHYIGELFGGGIVVAVWKEGGKEHGLITSLEDISTGLIWSDVDWSSIGGSAQSLVDGITNTYAIINQSWQSVIAASLCDSFRGGGFSDWYLPAIWELKECYNAAFIVNNIIGATNGFRINSTYWSSTEYSSTSAWYMDFNYGRTSATVKSTKLRVRAFRRF